MCGIVGIIARENVNQDLFDALTALQHRGQDAAGIATCEENGKVHCVKGSGLVRDVIRTRHMYRLQGNMGIGHVRYPTAGTFQDEEAQPFYVNSPYGITLAHNGNLTNVEELKEKIIAQDLRHLNTRSDSEVLLNVFAHALQSVSQKEPIQDRIFKAVSEVHARCAGAYSVVILLAGVGLLGFRDPHGIRPLVYGKRECEKGTEYMIASESVALDLAGFECLGDVAPGEAIFINKEGCFFRKSCATNVQHTPCLFEYVYLARPDSLIENISVYKVRLRLGELLADQIAREWKLDPLDVVIPVPDTSRTAGAIVARKLQLDFREGFVKNRYIGRTFIMPGQKQREKSVRQKLNTIPLEFQGKNVLLVDDSIVRGTTSREIIQMARDAGARKVYFASAAPEVRFPNVYGIDMPSRQELIAHAHTVSEIAERIGADGLIFQDFEALFTACHELNPAITRFEDSIFTGNYITGEINEQYLTDLAEARSDKVRSKAVLTG